MYDYYDYEDLSGYKSEEWFIGWLERQPIAEQWGYLLPHMEELPKPDSTTYPMEHSSAAVWAWAESCVQAQKAGATIENILSLPESSKLGDEYLGGEHGDDGPESFKLNLKE